MISLCPCSLTPQTTITAMLTTRPSIRIFSYRASNNRIAPRQRPAAEVLHLLVKAFRHFTDLTAGKITYPIHTADSRSGNHGGMDCVHSFLRQRYRKPLLPSDGYTTIPASTALDPAAPYILVAILSNLWYSFCESLGISPFLNVFSTIHFIGVPMTFLCLYEIANFIVLYRIRTLTNRVRVCRATITQFRNIHLEQQDLLYQIIWICQSLCRTF
jgi:hypothetical protein